MSKIGKGFISGPPLESSIPDCSFAEFFIPRLKAHPKQNIIQVDAQTGFSETSSDLLEKSLKIAEGLRIFGLGEDDVVCLIARNSSDVYALALGTLLNGGILAPMDTQLKIREIKHSFRNILRPSAVICEANLAPVVSSAVDVMDNTGKECKIIVFADKQTVKKPHIAFEDLLKVDVDVNSYVPRGVHSPSTKVAFILPTSGSTGMPKGVELTHRNLIFQAISLRNQFLGPATGCLVLSHFFWVSCLLSFLATIDRGIKRIYITDIKGKNVLQAIHTYKPDWCFMSSPAFMKILKDPHVGKYDLTCLKTVILGGCLISQAVIESANQLWNGKAPIANFYGASEITGAISINPTGENLLSVGKPLPSTQIKIIDPNTGKLLGPNERGEIVVKSEGLMKGYKGNQAATEEVITDGWCRTGDLGYYDENEFLYVVERLKELIKTEKGQISPTEIEDAIEMIPGVKEAGVVGMFSDTDMSFLVGLVVKRDPDLTVEDIEHFMKDNLADFKVPKILKFVSEIPRSSGGKVRRRELKEMAISMCT